MVFDVSLPTIAYRIFEIAPEAINLFPKFADVPPKELEKNEHFRHHALQVVEAVELGISMLQDVDDLRDVLISLGSIHVSMGLQDVHFDVRINAHEISLLHHNIYRFLFCPGGRRSIAVDRIKGTGWRLHPRSARRLELFLPIRRRVHEERAERLVRRSSCQMKSSRHLRTRQFITHSNKSIPINAFRCTRTLSLYYHYTII